MVRLLEAGEIPFEQSGAHRRVRLADVLNYRERARAAGLDEMVRVSEESRFYDLPTDLPFERLPVDHER